MPLYHYESEDEAGQKAVGLLEAENPAALRDQLSASGHRLKGIHIRPDDPGSTTVRTATSVSVTGQSGAGSAGAGPSSITSSGAVAGGAASHGQTAVRSGPTPVRGSSPHLSVRAHAILFRELASAFRAGMTAFQACDMLVGRYGTGAMGRILQWTRTQTAAGGSFAEALASAPVQLESSCIGIIRAGERGGFLPYVLDELGVSYERQDYLQNRIRPYKLMYIGMVLPALLLAWPLPRLLQGAAAASSGSNASVGGSLSGAFAAYGAGITHFSIPVGLALVVGWFLWTLWVRTPAGRRFSDSAALRVPTWGKMQRSLALGRFTRILAQLFRGGIPLREAWIMSADSVPNTSIAARLHAQDAAMASNGRISASMEASRLFGTGEVSMVATGEHTGEIDAMLMRLATYEDEALERGARSFPMVVHLLFLLAMSPLVIIVISHFFNGYMTTLLKWADG